MTTTSSTPVAPTAGHRGAGRRYPYRPTAGAAPPAGARTTSPPRCRASPRSASLVRMMNVFWWRPTTDRLGYLGYRLWGDAFYYHHQANALADGKFFIDPIQYVFDDGVEVPSAGHPPLYSTYLALWSLDRHRRRHRAPRWRRACSASPPSSWSDCVGKRIAGAAVGLIAAGDRRDLPASCGSTTAW